MNPTLYALIAWAVLVVGAPAIVAMAHYLREYRYRRIVRHRLRVIR